MQQIVYHFLYLTFLLISQNPAIYCQDEKEQKSKDILRQIETNLELTYNAFHKSEPDADYIYKAFTRNHPQFSNTEKDKTNDILYGENNYKIRYFRNKRSSVESSLGSIRKKLNEDRKKEREELGMAADANQRMEGNHTSEGITHSYGKICSLFFY